MSLSHWARFLAWLATETTALVAGAAMLLLWFRWPRARRAIWWAVFTTVALVWLFELSGLREKMPGPNPKQNHFILTPMQLRPLAPQTGIDDQGAEGAEPAVIPALVPGLETVKWPAWIWLAGSMLLLARFCMARVWLAVRRHTGTPVDPESFELIACWQSSFGLRRVQSQVWPSLRSPVAFGIFRGSVALPPDFVVRFSSAEREAMLAHEMAHLDAHDPFWLMVSDGVIAIAWWHPLVWWGRRKLQFANEAAADEASALIPGGAHALAECLVRLGRELTSTGPVRALGVSGSGLRSQLAARIDRLLQGPRIWQRSTIWARWAPQALAIFVSLASAFFPIQTGLSGSVLAVLLATSPERADIPPASLLSAAVTNQAPGNAGAGATSRVTTTGISALSYHGVNYDNDDFATPIPALATNPENTSKSEPLFLTKQENVIKSVVVLDSEANTNSPGHPVISKPSRVRRTDPQAKVSLVVQAVFIPEKNSDDIGLDWVFGLAPTNNPVLQTSHDAKALRTLPLIHGKDLGVSRLQIHDANALQTSPPIHGKHVVVDRLQTDGQSAILKPDQFAALFDRIVRQADILTAPACVTISGRQAHIADQNIQETVTDVEASGSSAVKEASVGYVTDEIALGLAVDILPRLEEDGKWRLSVLASETSFVGYDKYGKEFASVSNPAGKPIGYQIPHPHFRALEAVAEDSLLVGQTLALRGPLWTETTRTKGHFLVPAKTKTVRQRLYVFVTPTQPPLSKAEE